MQWLERSFRAHPRAAQAVYIGIIWFILAAAGSYLANRAAPGSLETHAMLASLLVVSYLAGFFGGSAQRGAA